jgi:hypothetical protein
VSEVISYIGEAIEELKAIDWLFRACRLKPIRW